MSITEFAKTELDLIGLTEDSSDEMNRYMRDNVLELIEMFANQGHSGMSAPYLIGILQSLMTYKPLSPLTGSDDEWTESTDNLYQNKRASNVFKNGKDGKAYWLDGIIFWEWYTEPDTKKTFKTYFTSKDSRVAIESFPWTMPDKPEYREADANR